MMRALAFLTALLASPAAAQSIAGGTVDPAPIAAAQAQAKADAALATAQAAQQAAAVACAPGSMMPRAEAVTASAGTATTCKRSDEIPLRISCTVSGVTGANGTGPVTWPAMASVPKLTITPYITSTETLPYRCYPVTGTVTTTGATIKCFRDRAILAILQLPVEAAPAGVTFDVFALPGS